MAVSRWGVAVCVRCVYSYGRRQPIKTQTWNVSQVVDLQWNRQTRALSSAKWALAPPNSLRYQNIKLPLLSHPFHHASQTQRGGYCGESVSVCVLAQQGESEVLLTLLEIPLSPHSKVGELFALGPYKFTGLSFPLTTVDGCREDDISVGCFKWNNVDVTKREHGCFRSLFEAERCPAPFRYGSHFYCFHCPGTEPGRGQVSRQDVGLGNKPVDLPMLLLTSLCSPAQRERENHTEEDSEREEKLALMYERLRSELPSFFMKSHDYSMYSDDMEFINGLINTKTRGRLLYQLTLSLWRLLSLCYCAEARLEVLKLTKHMEDRSIKARWRIRCLPYHSLLLHFYQKDKSHLYSSYDAFSTFYVGQDGLIHCHKVEKVMPSQPPVLPKVTALIAGALVALGVPEHRPALNLLPLLLSSLRQIRN